MRLRVVIMPKNLPSLVKEAYSNVTEATARNAYAASLAFWVLMYEANQHRVIAWPHLIYETVKMLLVGNALQFSIQRHFKPIVGWPQRPAQ
jgi:hypothetical protein